MSKLIKISARTKRDLDCIKRLVKKKYRLIEQPTYEQAIKFLVGRELRYGRKQTRNNKS